MKKIVNVIVILSIIFSSLFYTQVFANQQLSGLIVETSKDTVKSGENVTLTINFGAELASYAFHIAYDHDLLELVTVDGGQKNDDGEKVIISYTDDHGGEQTHTNLSATFKAKEVEETNSATFTITSNGLSGKEPETQTYDDISEQTKNITINPDYKPYDIKLNYTGNILMKTEKDMKLVVSSAMGEHYEHTRITATVEKPEGATATLMATDLESVEHDIFKEGWKENELGDSLGGKNAKRELNVRGLFSHAGKYEITFNVLDMDTDDTVIATKKITLNVKDPNVTTKDDNKENNKNKKPSTMPKTGNTAYVYLIPTIFILTAVYIVLKKKN